MPSISVKDVDQHRFVKALAAFLKKSGKLKVPEWIDLVKTSHGKELAPYDADWFYTRCASVARRMYLRSPVGTVTVARIFGVLKRNGVHPAHRVRGSRSVARASLQALEQLKLIEKCADGQNGRKLSLQGRRDLDRIAAQLKMKKKKKVAPVVIT